jgi:hypothetical protein
MGWAFSTHRREEKGTQRKENTWKTLKKMVDNIKMDLKDIGGCGPHSPGSEQRPMVGSCENGNEPSGSKKY